MKTVLVSVLVSAGLTVAFADDPVTVSTTAELVEALNTHNGGKSQVIIQLAAGDYFMPDVPTCTNAVSGLASILVDNVCLVGDGDAPEATKLIGTGKTRVIQLLNSGKCQNLMITNGCASTKYLDFGNSTRGGCVYGNGTLTNCVVAGGLGASHGGGVAEGTTLRACRITGNKATFGGGTFHVWAYDSLIDGNTATSGGGGGYADYRYDGCAISNNVSSGGSGGGAVNASISTNTVFVGNWAKTDGGAVAGSSSDADFAKDLKYSYWNCVFTNNFSGGNGGGAFHGTLHDCIVVGNSAAYGGGTYCADAYASVKAGTRICWNTAYRGHGGGSYAKSSNVMSNCVFHANVCSNNTATANGGAVYLGQLVDCEISGNAIFTVPKSTGSGSCSGCGVVHGAQLRRCCVYDNYADYYGALNACTATDCVLKDNLSGDSAHNAYKSDLIGCDVSGSGTYLGTALNTVFHDINGGDLMLTADRNPRLPPEGKTIGILAVSRCYGSFTNCLIRNNGQTGGALTMLYGHGSSWQPGPMVNCTIVSNVFNETFSTLKMARGMLSVANCVFADNFRRSGAKTEPSDLRLSSVEEGALSFTHSAYGASSSDLGLYSDGTLWKFGEGAFGCSPRFAHDRNAEHPYEPRASSPLVGRGVLMDWMTDAYDVRGDIADGKYRRLRDGKVDIGCYQCWLDPVGMLLLFR